MVSVGSFLFSLSYLVLPCLNLFIIGQIRGVTWDLPVGGMFFVKILLPLPPGGISPPPSLILCENYHKRYQKSGGRGEGHPLNQLGGMYRMFETKMDSRHISSNESSDNSKGVSFYNKYVGM